MPHEATAVANRLIELADANNHDLTLIQVVKLTYFCHAWTLGLYHRPLVRQKVEAWATGPVIRQVVQDFQKHGPNPVRPHRHTPQAELDSQEEDLIHQVYTKYGPLSGIRLSELSHEQGTPWDQVWSMNRSNSVIPHSIMQTHYSREAAASRTQQPQQDIQDRGSALTGTQ